MENTLETNLEEVQQDQARWLTAAVDKVSWCQDTAGDKYSIEAKLATINDLMASQDQGKQKTQVLAEKTDLLRRSLDGKRQKELESKQTTAQKDWDNYQETLRQAK